MAQLRKLEDGPEGDRSRDILEADLDLQEAFQGLADAQERNEERFRLRLRISRRVAEAMGLQLPQEAPGEPGQ